MLEPQAISLVRIGAAPREDERVLAFLGGEARRHARATGHLEAVDDVGCAGRRASAGDVVLRLEGVAVDRSVVQRDRQRISTRVATDARAAFDGEVRLESNTGREPWRRPSRQRRRTTRARAPRRTWPRRTSRPRRCIRARSTRRGRSGGHERPARSRRSGAERGRGRAGGRRGGGAPPAPCRGCNCRGRDRTRRKACPSSAP